LVQAVSVNFTPLHFLDSGLLGALLGATAERIATRLRSIFGPLLETFVFSEVSK
jgi:hypothetical protein